MKRIRQDRQPKPRRLKPSVIRLIVHRAITERNVPREFLANELIEEITKNGDIAPTQETAVKYISKARNADNPLDIPWTTAACSEYVTYFPPESIPFLLQLWRYSIHLDETFTIRHAIWASRLTFILKDMDIAESWLHSRRYAREEELSLLSKTGMRIFQLDGSLVMETWEKITAQSNLKLNNHTRDYIHHTEFPIARDNGIAEEYIHVLPDYGHGETLERHNELKRLYHLIINLPSSSKVFPDMETRMIYLNNLSRTSKLPKWTTLTPEEIKDTIIELRNWVLDQKYKGQGATDNEKPLNILRVEPLPFQPIHIFKRLGWTLKGEEK